MRTYISIHWKHRCHRAHTLAIFTFIKRSHIALLCVIWELDVVQCWSFLPLHKFISQNGEPKQQIITFIKFICSVSALKFYSRIVCVYFLWFVRFYLECFEPPSPQTNYKTQTHFHSNTMGINETEYEHFKHVPALQNWIRTQPHLPQNIGESIAFRNFISAFVFIFHSNPELKNNLHANISTLPLFVWIISIVVCQYWAHQLIIIIYYF